MNFSQSLVLKSESLLRHSPSQAPEQRASGTEKCPVGKLKHLLIWGFNSCRTQHLLLSPITLASAEL